MKLIIRLLQKLKYVSQKINKGDLFFFLMLAITLSLFWLFKINNIHEYTALVGFSPMSWVHIFKNPENFAFHFPAGHENYEKSSFMYVYILLSDFFKVPAASFYKIFILMEIVLIAIFCLVLINNYYKKTDYSFYLLSLLFFLTNFVRNSNLSNFSEPFYMGLYYNAADFFSVLAIVYAFKNNFFSVLFTAITFTIHPVKAFSTGAAIAPHINIKKFFKFKNILIFFTSLAISMAWYLTKYLTDTNNSGVIQKHEWLQLAKLQNFHFFPIQLGLLTSRTIEYFTPFVCLLSLSFYFLNSNIIELNLSKKIKTSLFFLLLLTTLGLLNSYFEISVFLTKLSLHRSSSLMILIMLPVVLYGIWENTYKNKVFFSLINFLILISLINLKNGFFILLLIPFFLADFKSLKELKSKDKYIPIILYFAALIHVLVLKHEYIFKNTYLVLTNKYTLITIFSFAALHRFYKLRLLKVVFLKYLALVLIVSHASYNLYKSQRPASFFEKAKSYLDLQIWAKKYSPADSVFMPEPTTYYGWTDYSERSSAGTVRDWTHNAWLYSSNFDNWKMGWERALYFDLTPGLIINRQLNSTEISKIAENAYYTMSSKNLIEFANSFKINYFIFEKKKLKYSIESYINFFRLAYENKLYIILEKR